MALGALAGVGFNHFFDRQSDTLQEASEKISLVIRGHVQAISHSIGSVDKMQRVEDFNECQTLIDNFSTVYSGQMSRLVEKVDKAAQESLAQIDLMVYNLGTKVKLFERPFYSQTSQDLSRAFMMSLLGKDLPFLKDVFPKSASPIKGATHVVIKCASFFSERNNPQLPPPLLMLRGQSFSHVPNRNDIEFSVPYSLLFSEKSGFEIVDFSVKIPYVIPGWFSNTIGYLEYKRWISLLPEFFGKISLEYVIASQKEKEEKEILATFWQDSHFGGEDRDIINKSHVLAVESGWRIVPDSSYMRVHCNEGKGNSWSGVTEGPTQVSFLASTHNKEENCGKLGIDLGARVVRYHEVAITTLEDLGLTWGESKDLDTSKWKSWKVIFEASDGSLREEHTGNVDTGYMSILSVGRQLFVSVNHYDEVMKILATAKSMSAKL